VVEILRLLYGVLLYFKIARRTKVAALFPNKESCLRLVTALLEEIHEDWMAGKMYLSIPDESEDADLPFYRKDVA
jgi:transposase-like protein